MDATILFPEINLFYSSISRRIPRQWISKSKRRRLNKTAKRKEAEKEGAAKSDQSPSSYKEPPPSKVPSSGVAAAITKPADGGRGRSDWKQPSDVPLPSNTGLLCASCQHLLDAQSTVSLVGSLQAMLSDDLEEGQTALKRRRAVPDPSPEQSLSSSLYRRYCLRPRLRF